MHISQIEVAQDPPTLLARAYMRTITYSFKYSRDVEMPANEIANTTCSTTTRLAPVTTVRASRLRPLQRLPQRTDYFISAPPDGITCVGSDPGEIRSRW